MKSDQSLSLKHGTGPFIRDILLFSVEPKRVYVKSCTVADTMDFDTTTATLIQDG